MTHDEQEAAPAAVTQTWWLSFSGTSGFLGVAIVDVEEDDATEAEAFVRERRAERGLVTGAVGGHAKYIGGALCVAHLMGCNPGSDAQCVRIDDHPNFPADDAAGKFPRNRLMSLPELKRVGAIVV